MGHWSPGGEAKGILAQQEGEREWPKRKFVNMGMHVGGSDFKGAGALLERIS